jgi:hypothetical protein
MRAAARWGSGSMFARKCLLWYVRKTSLPSFVCCLHRNETRGEINLVVLIDCELINSRRTNVTVSTDTPSNPSRQRQGEREEEEESEEDCVSRKRAAH